MKSESLCEILIFEKICTRTEDVEFAITEVSR